MKKRLKKSTRTKIIRQLKMSRKIRMGLVIFSVAAILVSGYLLYITHKYQKYTQKKDSIYSYRNSANVNYEVFLIPNNLFIEKSLGEGNVYLKRLIDYVNTTFKYEFMGEKPAKVDGKYKITALLEGFILGDESGRVVWKKEFVIQPETIFTGEDKLISIEKKIPIRIKDYLGFIELAEKTTEINFNVKLTVLWNVSMQGKTDKGNIKESLVPTIVIPISNDYFEIAGNLAEDKKGVIEETKQIISPTYTKKINLFYITGGIGTFLFLYVLLFTASSTKLSPIAKRRKQIFKDHGNRMAAVWSEISAVLKIVIEVSRIEDLVRIADDIGRPILYKNSLNEEEIYNFYVVDESRLYVFDIRREFECISEESNKEIGSVSM